MDYPKNGCDETASRRRTKNVWLEAHSECGAGMDAGVACPAAHRRGKIRPVDEDDWLSHCSLELLFGVAAKAEINEEQDKLNEGSGIL
jgi:hypothetical protein